MNLEELLESFRSEDIAHVLRGLGLAASGTKSQRLNRLLGATEGTVVSHVIALFRTDDLQRVCVQLGVDHGTLDQMVDRLAQRIATVQQEAQERQEPARVGATEPKGARLSGLKRVGIVAAIAALLYRLYRAIRRRG